MDSRTLGSPPSRTQSTTLPKGSPKVSGGLDGVVSWLTTAIAASILGMLIGGIVVVIVRQFTKHPEELIID